MSARKKDRSVSISNTGKKDAAPRKSLNVQKEKSGKIKNKNCERDGKAEVKNADDTSQEEKDSTSDRSRSSGGSNATFDKFSKKPDFNKTEQKPSARRNRPSTTVNAPLNAKSRKTDGDEGCQDITVEKRKSLNVSGKPNTDEDCENERFEKRKSLNVSRKSDIDEDCQNVTAEKRKSLNVSRISDTDEDCQDITVQRRRSSNVSRNPDIDEDCQDINVEKRRSSNVSRKSITKQAEDDDRDECDFEEVRETENPKLLRVYLENKYKFEIPVADRDSDAEDSNDCHPEDTSIKEKIRMLKIKDRFDAVLNQAEDFFSNNGTSSSEQPTCNAKPKKCVPMTMITFGPDYEDVIVCKDDEETCGMQACVLNVDNNKCPKNIKAVDLNVYEDGFKAEDEDFCAYSTESIRNFFMNNLGSFVIMKPNPDDPEETVLIRVIDERDRTYQCPTNKPRTSTTRKSSLKPQTNKTKKKIKPIKNQRTRRASNVEDDDEASEDMIDKNCLRPEFFGKGNGKPGNSPRESVEIYDKHKIIRKIENGKDTESVDKSSWYWQNNGKPLSSQYIVPQSTLEEQLNRRMNPPKQKNLNEAGTLRVEQLPSFTETPLQKNKFPLIEQPEDTPKPKTVPMAALDKEFTAKIIPISSFVDNEKPPVKSDNGPRRSQTQPGPSRNGRTSNASNLLRTNKVKEEDKLSITASLINGIKDGKVEEKTVEAPRVDVVKSKSDTKIRNVNIYHGPVTVINLNDKSNESVQISPTQDNKLKITSNTYKKSDAKTKTSKNDQNKENLTNVEQQETEKKQYEKMKMENYLSLWEEYSEEDHRLIKLNQDAENEIFFPPLDDGYNMYETEYDYAYNQAPLRWPEYYNEASRRASSAGRSGKDPLSEVTNLKHVTLLGRDIPLDEAQDQNTIVKKKSILLDLGAKSGNAKNDTVEGVELNEKTSDEQVTITLVHNTTGKKYLVNIYPEEQLKKIWSILKLNNIPIENVTPQLVLGNNANQSKAAETIRSKLQNENNDKNTLQNINTDDTWKDLIKDSPLKKDVKTNNEPQDKKKNFLEDVLTGAREPKDNQNDILGNLLKENEESELKKTKYLPNLEKEPSGNSILSKNSNPPSIGSEAS